jgi:type II secretory pathway predicted ATPase ExeA
LLYLEHFGLDEPPFRITPHTDFFFDGGDRGATLEALLYAIVHEEGIVKVSGEVGTGKTMLCRVLMERLPEHVEIVYLANPSFDRSEILGAIADDLGIEISERRINVALRALEDHLISLYSEGARVVLLIDEAHAMPEDTLEQVRLLSNLESSRHKLLQIVLFGQPELDSILAEPSMRQLKDRITHSFRMRPLVEKEIGNYLSFRMRAAGYRGPDVFSPAAVSMIAKAASGLSRRVNILADKALLAAFASNKHAVTRREAGAAIKDSDFGRLLDQRKPRPLVISAATALGGLIIGGALHWALTKNAPLIASQSPSQLASPVKAPSPPSSATPQPVEHKDSPIDRSSPLAASADTHSAKPPELPTSRLSPAAARRISEYKTGGNNLVKERVEATRQRLEREPDDSYSIELFSTENSDPARLERFLIRAKQLVPLDEVFILPEAGDSHYKVRVIYGGYPDKISANGALERLPPKYRQSFKPELRSFRELRAAL